MDDQVDVDEMKRMIGLIMMMMTTIMSATPTESKGEGYFEQRIRDSMNNLVYEVATKKHREMVPLHRPIDTFKWNVRPAIATLAPLASSTVSVP